MWLSQQNPLTSTRRGVVRRDHRVLGLADRALGVPGGRAVEAGLHRGQQHLPALSPVRYLGPAGGQQWRFYQFNVTNGPLTNYSGTVDAKVLADWVVSNYGLSRDLWVTRYEIGSEIDDKTPGTVKIKNLTFSVNNTAKSIELQP